MTDRFLAKTASDAQNSTYVQREAKYSICPAPSELDKALQQSQSQAQALQLPIDIGPPTARETQGSTIQLPRTQPWPKVVDNVPPRRRPVHHLNHLSVALPRLQSSCRHRYEVGSASHRSVVGQRVCARVNWRVCHGRHQAGGREAKAVAGRGGNHWRNGRAEAEARAWSATIRHER